MANISLSITLVILLCGLTLASRTKILPLSSTVTALAPELSDGVCSSLVKTQGYACEEHLVLVPNNTHARAEERNGSPLQQENCRSNASELPSDHTRIWSDLSATAVKNTSVMEERQAQQGTSLNDNEQREIQRIMIFVFDGVTWLLLPPSQSLAFLLADNGFDVWIANSRGTKYSHQHTSFSSNSSDYWNWSWDELVAYDLPATFEFIFCSSGGSSECFQMFLLQAVQLLLDCRDRLSSEDLSNKADSSPTDSQKLDPIQVYNTKGSKNLEVRILL
ncbi:unnamed protein product [Vicia faba]|uniref:Uncharacterized protein n=1 Tax=Vicia faba TaxID=3906 RepID=A0AAV1B0H1_VICFA|nr:unnamed protein product [Vicia faba]